MSDLNAQQNEKQVLGEVELEDPNIDGQFSNGWEEEDHFAYDYSAHLVKHPLRSVKELEQNLRI
jgi:hypothetical protein